MVLTVTATQPLFTIIRASRNHQTATNHPPTPRQKPPCEPSTLFHTSTCTTAAAMASHAFSFTSQPRSQPPPNHFKPCPRLTTSTIVTIKQPPNDRRAIFHFLYEATPFSSLFCACGNANASNQNNLRKENGLRGWLGLTHFGIYPIFFSLSLASNEYRGLGFAFPFFTFLVPFILLFICLFYFGPICFFFKFET